MTQLLHEASQHQPPKQGNKLSKYSVIRYMKCSDVVLWSLDCSIKRITRCCSLSVQSSNSHRQPATTIVPVRLYKNTHRRTYISARLNLLSVIWNTGRLPRTSVPNMPYCAHGAHCRVAVEITRPFLFIWFAVRLSSAYILGFVLFCIASLYMVFHPCSCEHSEGFSCCLVVWSDMYSSLACQKGRC